jgi:hypothetical protein
MLNDENRTGVFIPDGVFNSGRNIVGSGSDGTTYWNLFNIEGESAASAAFVTYGTLADMLNDENRISAVLGDGAGSGRNIVGTGFFFDAVSPVPEPSMSWLVLVALGATHIARRGFRLGTSLSTSTLATGTASVLAPRAG